MKNSATSTSSDFSVEIESLRGIAALLVLFGHLYLFGNLAHLFQTASSNTLNGLIGIVVNPQPPVLLFFTISGLVLGRQLRKNPVDSLPTFLGYLCRRGFRLFPLIWVSTIFAVVLQKGNFTDLLNTLLLKDFRFNPVLWSIQVELWCSLFFPFLFFMFRSSGIFLNVSLFIALTLISFFLKHPLFMQFWVFFHAGLVVDALSAKATSRKLNNPLIFILAYLIFILAPEYSIGVRNWMYGCWQSWVLPEIVACSLILFFIVHNKKSFINSFLRLSWIRYLGKISFSFYLIHFTLLQLLLVKYPISSFSYLVVFTLVLIALTVLLSSLTYHLMEAPFNRLGRRINNYIVNDLFSKPMPDKGDILMPEI
ncbi:MAG: acyltransferase [Tatlockia sp.]|nr:acyltransferase [Tatlockia sp.]